MIPSNASPIASVKMNDPDTNATPSTIANALRAERTLRARTFFRVILGAGVESALGVGRMPAVDQRSAPNSQFPRRAAAGAPPVRSVCS